MKQPNPESLPVTEWFYPFTADTVPASGKVVKMQADASQLKEIAERLGVAELKSIKAELRLSLKNSGHILHIEGEFNAEIVQECVMSLQPVESSVSDTFEAWFADHSKAASFTRAKHQMKAMEEGDEVQVLEEKDDPEPLVNGQVDLGEVVVQFLSLSIDPYPRAAGMEESPIAEAIQGKGVKQVSPSSLRPNPFAALKNWRPKD